MRTIDEASRRAQARLIRSWMRRNVEEFRDPRTGEINHTEMTEEWDRECSTGEATLDPDHVAWDVAVEVAEEAEKTKQENPEWAPEGVDEEAELDHYAFMTKGKY